MSRSRKLPIYKDKGWKKYYWKNTRSSIKNSLRSQLYNDLDYLELPNPKIILWILNIFLGSNTRKFGINLRNEIGGF